MGRSVSPARATSAAPGQISGLGGAGQLSGSDSATFAGFAAYDIGAGGAWILSGANALGAGQVLTVDGVASVTAALAEAAGASLTVGPAFKGQGGSLELAQSLGFTAAVTGFMAAGRQSLDLGDIGFTGAGEATFSGTASGGVLTVGDARHTALITLKGDYLGDTFTAAADGHGGVAVTALPTPHAFVAAMTTMGAGRAGPVPARADGWRGAAEAMLVAPRAALA